MFGKKGENDKTRNQPYASDSSYFHSSRKRAPMHLVTVNAVFVRYSEVVTFLFTFNEF